MRFDMFELFGPGRFRSKPKPRPSLATSAAQVRRPMPTGVSQPFAPQFEITSEGERGIDPEDRAFRALDRHTRWAIVNELNHARAPQ